MAVYQTLTVTEVAGSASSTNNTSQVRILWKSQQTGGSYNETVRTAYYYVSINGGAETEYSVSYTLPLNTTKTIVDTTITVPHKDNGSGTVKVRTWMNTNISAGVVEKSQSVTLTTIARASQISSAGAITLGNACNVKWTPKSASFRYKLKFSLGKWSEWSSVIHPNRTTAYTYTGYKVPMIVAEQILSGYEGTMTVTLYTYSNSGATTQVGSEDSETFKVTVPSSTLPTVTMSLSPVHNLPEAFNGIYVQGLSKVKAELSAETQYKASISYYDMTVEGKTYGSADKYTSAYLTSTGTVGVSGHAVDSRSYGGYALGSITVIPYAHPKIQKVTAKRCDKSGTLSDAGTYLKITATRSYSPVKSNKVQKNFCQIRYRYKAESASSYSSWVTILSGTDLSSDTVTTDALLGNLSATTSYRVEVQAIDDIGNTSVVTVVVPTDKIYWHRDGAKNSFTFGGYVEDSNTFAIAAGVKFVVKSLTGKTVNISDTGWIDLGLSESVSVPSDSYNYGRNGPGCYYRVINGNHVYVAFNCACEYADSTIKVNDTLIPSDYAPKYTVFTLSPATSRYIVRAIVNKSGQVQINYVQSLTSAAQTDTASVAWIDGYIDYFV